MDEGRLNEVKDNFSGKIDTQVVDVTKWDSVNAAAENSFKSIGGADILVNSAGIAGPNFKTWEYPIEEWMKVVDIDLNGTFLCCRALVPFMRENKYGRIVNIASIAGKEGNPNAAPYSAAKAGVIGLTKSLGKELADMNITVNCITPAAVRTEIFDQISQEHIDFMLSKIPIGRFGTVDEIANLITWLSSEECSFSTGGVFDISGGRATY
jgi:3-oxoacyl-[acyl-carrier protein] reductase